MGGMPVRWRRFTPDVKLHEGDVAAGMVAVFTPGHAADHVCFARPDGVLFSADHVMGWSSSVVSPPNGDMAAYVASLKKLLGRADTLYLPGHGPALPDPHPYVQALLEHRMAREESIAAAIAGRAGDAGGAGGAAVFEDRPDPEAGGGAERDLASAEAAA